MADREIRTPVAIHIGLLSNIGRRDAAAHVQGLIRRQMIAPEIAAWRLVRSADGYAYEIHEGGDRRSVLPTLLALLQEDPDAVFHLPAGDRVVRVSIEDEAIRSVTLPEDEEAEIDAIKPSGRLRPFEPTGAGPLLTAAVFFCVASVTFLAAVFVTGQASQQWRQSTEAAASLSVEALPIRHWPDRPSDGRFVSRVQYVAGNWHVQTEHVEQPAPPQAAKLPDIPTRPAPE